jgi:hypothetical protein
MAMSALCAPIYLKSLTSALLRTQGRFVVTPKGGEASPDRPATFRIHLYWAAVLAVSLLASVILDHTHAAMRTWAVLALGIALAPVGVWGWGLLQERRARARLRAPEPGSPVRVTLKAKAKVTPKAGDEPEPAFATTTGGN